MTYRSQPQSFFALGLVAVISAVASGCAVQRDYVYRPSTAAVAEVTGFEAGVYPVPPERPQGEVRVLSFGVTYLKDASGATSFPALHARLMVANNGDETPWTLNTAEVTLEIAGEGSAAPMYANTDQGGTPQITVDRGQQRVVDLYFPVPGTVADADHLPAFDVKWQVQTGSRLVAERTPFQRFELQPRPAPSPNVVVVAGWGPIWWLRPHHPRAHVFVHAPIMVVPGPHRVVVVKRPGRYR
jgi:hypothetical protein